MFDATFLITDWEDNQGEGELSFTPPMPDDEIPDREKERLFNELCVLIDSGAFDPDRELPF